MTTPTTPGPWEHYTAGIVRIKGESTVVAECRAYKPQHYKGHVIEWDEAEANARLIATLPEKLAIYDAMLEVVTAIVEEDVRCSCGPHADPGDPCPRCKAETALALVREVS